MEEAKAWKVILWHVGILVVTVLVAGNPDGVGCSMVNEVEEDGSIGTSVSGVSPQGLLCVTTGP
jgi:hypothetical protein